MIWDMSGKISRGSSRRTDIYKYILPLDFCVVQAPWSRADEMLEGDENRHANAARTTKHTVQVAVVACICLCEGCFCCNPAAQDDSHP